MVGDCLMPLMNTAFKPGQCRSVEVKGGNLQASGTTNGIHFLSNANDATAVANLKVSGNAMVKASNISTTKDGTGSVPELKPAASGSDGTGGIIWDGKNGTVYGSVTLDENLTIGEGESLTIPEGGLSEHEWQHHHGGERRQAGGYTDRHSRLRPHHHYRKPA